MLLCSQLGFLFLVLAAMILLAILLSAQRIPLFKYVVFIQVAGGFIVLSYVCLSLCFLCDEFHLNYVAAHSSTILPWYYKLCAVWGGHEGSMLLWVTILAGYTLILSLQLRYLNSIHAYSILSVLVIILLALLCFIIFVSNPFGLQFNRISEGLDLNPLLQDPGFLLHPPMLYFGYVAYAIPFAISMSILMQTQYEHTLLMLIKIWASFSWICLSSGITLGSWWAYRELGWGGFWFWDPVENASLMPWLMGTALLHALKVADKQASFVTWVILLSIVAFCLSLVGTFLVRSGVLTSVHVFALDPKRGLYILGFLAAMIMWSIVMYAWRSHRLFVSKQYYWFSRESSLLMNHILLMIMTLIILLGTIYPLIIDGMNLGKISVGAPYFNETLFPLLILFLMVMALGVQINWGYDRANRIMLHIGLQFVLAVLLSIVLTWTLFHQCLVKVILCAGLSFWVLLSLWHGLYRRVRQHQKFPKSMSYWAMFCAHTGFAMAILGIIFVSAFGIEYDLNMQPQEQIYLGDYQIKFVQEKNIQGVNYHGSQVQFHIHAHHFDADVFPEKRIYSIGHMVMTEAAIHYNFWRDIYVALGHPNGVDNWSVRLYYKPLVRWIWLGGLCISLGGFLTLLSSIRVHYRNLK